MASWVLREGLLTVKNIPVLVMACFCSLQSHCQLKPREMGGAAARLCPNAARHGMYTERQPWDGAAQALVFSSHPPGRDPFPDSIKPWASHTPASTGPHPQSSRPFISRQGVTKLLMLTLDLGLPHLSILTAGIQAQASRRGSHLCCVCGLCCLSSHGTLVTSISLCAPA